MTIDKKVVAVLLVFLIDRNCTVERLILLLQTKQYYLDQARFICHYSLFTLKEKNVETMKGRKY